MFEAHCTKCKESFNPADENDLIHLVRSDGQECGGQGELRGEWLTQGDRRGRTHREP